MKTVDLLIAAQNRIRDPNNWVRGTMYAKKTNYDPRSADEVSLYGAYANRQDSVDSANCFCSVGSVAAELGVPHIRYIGLHQLDKEDNDAIVEEYGPAFKRAVKYLDAAALQLKSASAYCLNDTRTHDDVMTMYNLAIKNAKRRHANGKRYANGTR